MECWSNEMNSPANTPLLHTPFSLLAEEFHDIAPPVDYSLIPPWVDFLRIAFVVAVTARSDRLVVCAAGGNQKPQQRHANARSSNSNEFGREIERTDALSIQHPRLRHSAALRDGAVSSCR